jgi:hypothetical protein
MERRESVKIRKGSNSALPVWKHRPSANAEPGTCLPSTIQTHFSGSTIMRTILPRAVKPPIGISKKAQAHQPAPNFVAREDREAGKGSWLKKREFSYPQLSTIHHQPFRRGEIARA